ncbi:hypothetical protein Mboo_2026 [Methanoregula boonei 6A8]|jgi:hypothetical protein|uniref:Uncharacterized protein n=1 Tax=Methanoregula boonei (strain DSM 21154 / JCM 14090 / 6A8) TaxID=456442 RepID=A7I9X9_METB6|nr:hypothetical protein [Methanoregula boonei]ABS56540.1 hypothetical protein Mboo_2026 [Methanoregula boonei 6A8]
MTTEINEQDVIAPGALASGASYSNRINPCEAVAGEITVILHTAPGGNEAGTAQRYSRNTAHVHEALKILAAHGYVPVRLAESPLPVSIIAFSKDDPLLVLVISARKPVPSAARLRTDYPGAVEYLCPMAARLHCRIMIWVYSPACGWRYYRVYPGGLAYDHRFPSSLED